MFCADKPCTPHVDEYSSRLKDLQTRLQAGEFEHSDLAIYTMHLNAVKSHQKYILRKREIADVRERLRIVYPPVDEKPEASMAKLPPVLAEMLVGADTFKIEWMFEGGYDVVSSGEFKAAFGFNNKGFAKNIYRKLQETLGFSKYDTAYKMWTETLHRPGVVIRYQGKAMRDGQPTPVVQVARMCSYVYDYEHVVSVVTVTTNKEN